MGKKIIETGWEVRVTPKRIGDFGFARVSDRMISKDIARDYRERCEEIVEQIKRHVDNVSHVQIEIDREIVCEFCSSKWTESGHHNGGCCDKDCELMESFEQEKGPQNV